MIGLQSTFVLIDLPKVGKPSAVATGAKSPLPEFSLLIYNICHVDGEPKISTMSVEPQYIEERLSPTVDLADHTTQILTKDAFSLDISITGVPRADGVQLASNGPCEDRFNRVQLFSPWDSEKWIAASVFDGHNGWQTADHLEKELLGCVERALRKLEPHSRDEDSIRHAIGKAFTDLDHSIVDAYASNTHNKQMGLDKKMQYMEVAMSGSCALLSLYDPSTCNIYTACTGDSRAVLGQQGSDGIWAVLPLSVDQKGDNEEEITRIQQEHPREKGIVKDGAVLGLRVSRAFADVPWKLPYDVQLDLGHRYYTNDPMEIIKVLTPPYITAEPVVTVVKAGRPSFLVLATDGLWDQCTSMEVIDLVTRWLEAQPEAAKYMKITPPTVWWKSEPPHQPDWKPGFDFLQRWDGFDLRFEEERTAIEDLDNVAVHLLRNACGGNHRELLAGTLAVRPPYSRDLRDDITIQVIFFGIMGKAEETLRSIET